MPTHLSQQLSSLAQQFLPDETTSHAYYFRISKEALVYHSVYSV